MAKSIYKERILEQLRLLNAEVRMLEDLLADCRRLKEEEAEETEEGEN